jgi:excisionase family DNA binding protein
MEWKKVPDAARTWAGNTSPKTMYAAIRAGRLKAARIGAGRNVLVCEQHVDEWLMSTVRRESREGCASS